MRSLGTSVVAILAMTGAVRAAEADLAAKREAKLAEGWVSSGGWITDYEKALEASKASGKPVFAYFTRSYAT